VLRDRQAECRRVAAQRGRPDADPVAVAHDRVIAQRASQEVERGAKRVASARAVGRGPEQAEQRVAAVEALGPCRREVCEQGEALRLREHGAHRIAIAAQVDGAEGKELDHSGYIRLGRRYPKDNARLNRAVTPSRQFTRSRNGAHGSGSMMPRWVPRQFRTGAAAGRPTKDEIEPCKGSGHTCWWWPQRCTAWPVTIGRRSRRSRRRWTSSG